MVAMRNPYIPVAWLYNPVKRTLRLALQLAVVQYARVNRVPSAASRSMPGVPRAVSIATHLRPQVVSNDQNDVALFFGRGDIITGAQCDKSQHKRTQTPKPLPHGITSDYFLIASPSGPGDKNGDSQRKSDAVFTLDHQAVFCPRDGAKRIVDIRQHGAVPTAMPPT